MHTPAVNLNQKWQFPFSTRRRTSLVSAFIARTRMFISTPLPQVRDKVSRTKPPKPHGGGGERRRKKQPQEAAARAGGGMGGSSASPCDLDREFAPQIAQLLATPPLQPAQVRFLFPSLAHPSSGSKIYLLGNCLCCDYCFSL